MTTRIADYSPAITEPSRLELISIARQLKENDFTAYLVGGWAVYYYTKPEERPAGKAGEAVVDQSRVEDPHGFQALGSKDIDLIFEDKKTKEECEELCRKNGFFRRRSNMLGKTELVKRVENTSIILDSDTLSNSWTVRGTEIGWKDLIPHHASIPLESISSISVPSKELLLLYKCIALVQRTDNSKRVSADANLFESKIWKDANDILALHDTGIDEGVLARLAKETGLANILSAAKQIISSNYDSYGFTQYAFAHRFLKPTK